MRNFRIFLIMLLSVLLTQGASAQYTAKVHKEGPDTLVIEDGGTIEVKSGGTVTLEGTPIAVVNYPAVTPGVAAADAGVVLDADKNVDGMSLTNPKVALTAIPAAAAAYNYLVATPGVAAASKALVAGATKNLDELDVIAYKSDGITLSNVKCSTVTVTAALLDEAGTVAVAAAATGDSYKVLEIVLVGGGTNFDAAGDRTIVLTDGTTTYTTIANADIETAPTNSLRWGDAKVPNPTSVVDTATVAGQAVRFAYAGGTTDHDGTGSIKFRVCMEKVA